MKRIQRKGETQTGYLVPLVIGIFVLILLVFGVYNLGKWQGWWATNIPIPGQQNVTLNIASATFRYLPAADRVEYYTGNVWERFEGKSADIGNKRIQYDALKKQFHDYYFAYRDSQLIFLPPKDQAGLYPSEYAEGLRTVPLLGARTLIVISTPEQANTEREGFWGKIYRVTLLGPASVLYSTTERLYERGDSVLALVNALDGSDTKLYGSIVFDLKGNLWMQRLKKDLSTPDGVFVQQNTAQEPYQMLAERVAAWRDSVLKKPVSLTIGKLEGGVEKGSETRHYCPEKVVYQGELSVVVRLEQSTTAERC